MTQGGWRDALFKQGFAILPKLLPPEELDYLRKEISQSSPHRSRAGVRHALGLPAVAEVARGTDLMALAEEMLGSEAYPFRATLFDKSPHSNWLVVWHQDTALPVQERIELKGWGPWSVKEGIQYAHAPVAALSQVVALRVHLDDSTSDNGPLRILPCTHTLGVLDDDTIHDLSTQIAPFDCIVPKGGVVAMRPLSVHASSKSHTELPRRVLHIEYAASQSIARPLELAIA